MRVRSRALLCASLVLAWTAVASAPASAVKEGLIEKFPVPVATQVESLGEIAADADGDIWFARYHEYLSPLEHVNPKGALGPPLETPFGSRSVDLAQGPGGTMWYVSEKWLEEQPGEEMVRLEQVSVSLTSEPPIPPSALKGVGIPLAMGEGAEDTMWLAEPGPKAGEVAFAKLASDGTVAYYPIPTGNAQDEPTQSAPSALVAGPEGDIWFTDDGHNTLGEDLVGRVTPSGEVKEFPIPTAGSDPLGIAVSTEGVIWFTENGVNKIGRISPSGAVVEVGSPPLTGGRHGIARGPEGTMWFATAGDSGIGWISPSDELHSVPAVLLDGGQPVALTTGAEGDPWYLEQRPLGQSYLSEYFITRLLVPSVPTAMTAPVVTGTASAGSLLTATSGVWKEHPTTLSYQWERCDALGNRCAAIVGAASETYFLDASDVGQTLRVTVTVSDLLGSTSSASAPTALVSGAATDSPLSTLAAMPASDMPAPATPAPVPTLGVTITWLPVATGRATRFASLVAHGLRPGTVVKLSCGGRRCPFRRVDFVARAATAKRTHCAGKCGAHDLPSVTHDGELSLTSVVAAARLQRGASLTVRFARPGWLGQSYTLTVGAQHAVAVHRECLASGSLVQLIPCGAA